MKDKALEGLELFGHGLVLLIAIGLITHRLNSWYPLVVYTAIQLVVMTLDRFKTLQAWPFIVRDWRQNRKTN